MLSGSELGEVSHHKDSIASVGKSVYLLGNNEIRDRVWGRCIELTDGLARHQIENFEAATIWLIGYYVSLIESN